MRMPTGWAAAAVALMLVIAGCTDDHQGRSRRPSPPPSGGTLVIWSDATRADAVEKYAEKFAKDSGFAVEVRSVATDLRGEFVAANRSGGAPDVVLGSHDWIGGLIKEGAIEPVPLTSAQRGGFAEVAVRAVTYNGQTYGLPFGIENLVLFRNTELVPDPPRTIEEVVSIGDQLKRVGRIGRTLAMPVGDAGDWFYAYPLFVSAGGYLFGTKSNGELDLDDFGMRKPEAATAFSKIASLGEQGAGVLDRSTGTDAAVSAFATGRTPFLVATAAAVPEIKRAGVGFDVSPVPGFYGGKAVVSPIRVPAMFVASKGANKELAKRFVTEMGTAIDLPAALFAAFPIPPALTLAMDKVKADNPEAPRILDSARGGFIVPPVPWWTSALAPFATAEAAVVGGADVQTTVLRAAEEMATRIER